MDRIKFLFMLVVLDFMSDWYSIHKVTARGAQLNKTFDMINRLRGSIRDIIENKTTGDNHEG